MVFPATGMQCGGLNHPTAMWQLIRQIGRVTHTLVWDRESAIGGGRASMPAAAFAGTLATRITTDLTARSDSLTSCANGTEPDRDSWQQRER